MARLYLISLLLFAVSTAAECQQLADTVKLRHYVDTYGQAQVSVKYPGFGKASELSRDFSVYRYYDGRLYLVINHLSVDDFLRRGLEFDIDEPFGAKGVETHVSQAKLAEWQSYPTYTQYDSIMQRFVTGYPSLCRIDTIGTSVMGRLVLVLRISDNVHVDEYDEPEVFYTSSMHGDELGGFILMLRLADYLLQNYTTDDYVRYLVDNLQIYINPLANPDGTYRTGNTIVNPVRANANGRDLNRNFPDPLQPGVVQEKENQDMISFMKQRRFVLSANFHSGAEVVNYPWDRWTRLHPDDSWFLRLGRAYADTVHRYAPADYLNDFSNGVVRGSVWYVIYGGRQDYVTWELNGREVTIELDDTKVTPASQLEDLWQYNYRSLLNYLSFALTGVTGRVRNSETGEGIRARITVANHDTAPDSSHIYSFLPSGHYNRLIDGGTWAFRFSADGFRDTLITGIEVTAGERFPLDVFLKPLNSVDDTIKTGIMLVFPNPSAGRFSIVLPENNSGKVQLALISAGGRNVWSGEIDYRDYVPGSIEIPGLSPGIYLLRATNRVTGRNYLARVVIVQKVF